MCLVMVRSIPFGFSSYSLPTPVREWRNHINNSTAPMSIITRVPSVAAEQDKAGKVEELRASM
jgi:hypothetical protein